MSDERPDGPPRAPASQRQYVDGGCSLCHHEPLGDGRRKVVWTQPGRPGRETQWRCSEVERCPWSRCPQHAPKKDS